MMSSTVLPKRLPPFIEKKVRKASFTLAALTVLSLATTQPTSAAAIRSGFDTSSLAANDDGSTGLVSTGFDTNFYGETFSKLYVNNNGNVTFDSPLATFTPFGLTNTSRKIIAPFFADVDTRGTGSGLTTYGVGTVDGRNAFGATWKDVGYFSSRTDKLNSFQLVLIDRTDTGAGNFDIEFNYDKIQWETGGASGGRNGLGGSSVRVGYSNGTGVGGTFFELPGSAVNGAFLDSNTSTGLIYNNLNSNVDGQYIFSARNGQVITPDPVVVTPGPVPEPVPEPITIFSSGIALGFGILMKRKSSQNLKKSAN